MNLKRTITDAKIRTLFGDNLVGPMEIRAIIERNMQGKIARMVKTGRKYKRKAVDYEDE